MHSLSITHCISLIPISPPYFIAVLYFSSIFYFSSVFHLCILFAVQAAAPIKASHFEHSTNNQFLELHCAGNLFIKLIRGQNLESVKLETAMMPFTKPFTPSLPLSCKEKVAVRRLFSRIGQFCKTFQKSHPPPCERPILQNCLTIFSSAFLPPLLIARL